MFWFSNFQHLIPGETRYEINQPHQQLFHSAVTTSISHAHCFRHLPVRLCSSQSLRGDGQKRWRTDIAISAGSYVPHSVPGFFRSQPAEVVKTDGKFHTFAVFYLQKVLVFAPSLCKTFLPITMYFFFGKHIPASHFLRAHHVYLFFWNPQFHKFLSRVIYPMRDVDRASTRNIVKPPLNRFSSDSYNDFTKSSSSRSNWSCSSNRSLCTRNKNSLTTAKSGMPGEIAWGVLHPAFELICHIYSSFD